MTLSLIRCPHCGTYRLLGSDPCDCTTKLPPVIIGEGDIDDQIRYAIRCVCGEDRVIEEVELARASVPAKVLDGAKLFYATSQNSTCEHNPPCEWVDKVYWCTDRSVVVRMSQLYTTTLADALRQL